jgi:hypothetical protein
MFIECKKTGTVPLIYRPKLTTPGWIGCRDAHLDILNRSKLYFEFIIYEDDYTIIGNMRDYNRAVAQLPSDWDMLYLGCSPQSKQERYSANLFKATDSLTTHAILWNKRPGGAVEYILEHRDEINKIDVYLREVIQPKFNCFTVYPILCTQLQTKSDIAQRSDVSTIVTNYNKYCQ